MERYYEANGVDVRCSVCIEKMSQTREVMLLSKNEVKHLWSCDSLEHQGQHQDDVFLFVYSYLFEFLLLIFIYSLDDI